MKDENGWLQRLKNDVNAQAQKKKNMFYALCSMFSFTLPISKAAW